MLKTLFLCLILYKLTITVFCGDIFSSIVENYSDLNTGYIGDIKNIEMDTDIKKESNFVKGNKRWFKSKKDHMKFTPQKGIELGKKVALNSSIGVIWIYEPGLLLAEELVSPCFGIIFYYPNVQVSLMKGDKFLGVLCDAREHKPISKDRFKWYIAVGNDLTFTPRHYVKEGAYIKEGQEIGHLSKPAKSVGRVAIKSRARCSGIIILCKPGLVNTGEEFLRISCDISSNPNGVHNQLTDETHTSLLDQSDLGKSIPKLRGLAQVSIQEADYNGENMELQQMASLSDQGDSELQEGDSESSGLISEFFDDNEDKDESENPGNKGQIQKHSIKVETNLIVDDVSTERREKETRRGKKKTGRGNKKTGRREEEARGEKKDGKCENCLKKSQNNTKCGTRKKCY
ncbi:transmembrane protein [Cryptosporidium xiaoi]|uniref:Transmembrane protein n=1 Tax=Cryptosporidium xiaoi TaxID=659607 RepID=A0AAV9XTP8_9CRYT